jgi:hypothetical protein
LEIDTVKVGVQISKATKRRLTFYLMAGRRCF